MIDNHNPPKISSGAEEEREGERREKLQCINDPCVPTRRAPLSRSLARSAERALRRAGRKGPALPPDGHRRTRRAAGGAAGRALPKGSWRNSWLAGPPSLSPSAPAPPASRAASVRSAGPAPLRSAPAGTAAGHGREGSAGRATRAGVSPLRFTSSALFYFSPPFPSGFPSEVF